MANRSVLVLIVLVLAALLISSAAFTVKETDLAIKFQIGQIVKIRLSARLALHDAAGQ